MNGQANQGYTAEQLLTVTHRAHTAIKCFYRHVRNRAAGHVTVYDSKPQDTQIA